MKRTLLGMLLLTGSLLGLAAPRAAGRDDEPEKVSLADLKTPLLRKMVAAHAADYAADESRAAKAAALTHVRGAAAVAKRLGYAFEGGKPSVVFDATDLTTEVGPADRDAALAAVKDLLEYALNKVADGGVVVDEKKVTLAKADVKPLAGSARILWRAAPPPPDASKALAARLDALAKSLEKIEARVAKAEKDAPGEAKRVDDLTAEVKKAGEAVKELGKLAPAVQKAAERVDGLEGKAKALAERADKQDKALAEAAVALQKLREDAALALKVQRDELLATMKKQNDVLTAGLQKQRDEVKFLADRLARAEDLANDQGKRVKGLEDRVRREADERKKAEGRLKKIEAVLFPPITSYQLVDKGHYSWCFAQGLCAPTPVWVPCPVWVPIATKGQEEAKPVESAPPAKPAGQTTDTVAKAPAPRPARAVVPVYHTDGLRAADAPAVYRDGVRLYHAGEFAPALARFDAAIRLDGEDARPWYYKSLAEAALGDAPAAAKSRDRAAALHLQGKPPADKVSQALERIQGPARLQFREALDSRRARR